MEYTREQKLEAADILDRAHDVILQSGWAHDADGLANGECVETAVNRACGIERRVNSLGNSVITLDTLRLNMQGLGWLPVFLESRGLDWVWNDEPGRTEDEVFDRLRTVAKELREEASQ